MNAFKKSILLAIVIIAAAVPSNMFGQATKTIGNKGNVVNPADKDPGYLNFCDALGKLIWATDDEFVSESGKLIDTMGGMKTWVSKLDLPEVKSSYIKDEIVISKYYRGRFKNYASKDSVKMQYDKLAMYLDKCMKTKGYNIQKRPNDKGLKEFDEIIYRLPDDSSVPMEKQPFIKMEVVFDEGGKFYYIAIDVNVSFL